MDIYLKIILIINKIIHFTKRDNTQIKIPLFSGKNIFIKDNGCIITTSRKIFNKNIKYNNSEDIPLFYCTIQSWDYKAAMEERYYKNLKFLKEHFISRLKPEDIICDIGCASGQFTFEMAKYCKYVDAYDMSYNLIKDAKEQAKVNKIDNISFYQGCCESIKFSRQYDNISFMGVLSYVFDDKDADIAIKNIHSALKSGGYLIYKDNSNDAHKNYYFFGPDKNYKMIARAKETIVDLFEKNGFRIIEEELFERVRHKSKNTDDVLETTSIGMILQKV